MTWAGILMIVPVLNQSSNTRNAYFPKGRWFDYYDGKEIDSNSTTGRTKQLQINDNKIGLFIAGGNILPWQEPGQSTFESRQNPMGLLVALDENKSAIGFLFWDDGETLGTDQSGNFLGINFSAQFTGPFIGYLTITCTHDGYTGAGSLKFQSVEIFGFPQMPNEIIVNGIQLANSYINYDSTNRVLALSNLNIPINSASTKIQWN